MKEILQDDNLLLREVAQKIELNQIKSDYINTVVQEMEEAMDATKDGVAIAAPQIGYKLRIFVISKRAWKQYNNQERVFINPVIIRVSNKKETIDEGCLSVRWKYGKTVRHKQCTVRAYNLQGEKFEVGGAGLLSQIFQHEIDHLDGILFTDHANDVKDIPPSDEKEHE